MKNFMLLLLAAGAANGYSQTDSTTIITGSLRVNDSLNVSNNLQAGSIQSLGDVRTQSNLKTDSDLYVSGNAYLSGKLEVTGVSRFTGGVKTTSLVIGSPANNYAILAQTLSGGSGVLAFGFTGPIQELPSTCVQPYNSSVLSVFNSRTAVIKSSSANMLDFNNDGSNGYIDYGYDNQLHAMPINGVSPAPVPALKLNSHCYGDVEIAKGGGYLSAGNWLEVGSPARNGNVAANISGGNSRTGLRVTSSSTMPDSYQQFPDVYNTQLFVNRNKMKALAVVNTGTNTAGDQTFVVYGNGRTHIGTGRPLASGICPNAMLSVDGTILAKEVRVAISTTTHWADYVFDKNYKLMPLHELERFIGLHKHLPEVPSSEEVEKNGIEVTEISATLLKKIEELTLYTIELQKKLEAQQKEINNLKKQ